MICSVTVRTAISWSSGPIETSPDWPAEATNSIRRSQRRDLAALHGAAEKVRQYVNQHVAHDQAEPTMTDLPTFGDLHDAIDGIGEIFQKYAVMLTGGWNLLEPVIQDDWKAIFREPWIPPET